MRQVSPEQVAIEARKLINSPYKHQGRIPGEAIDCAGVPIVVCRNLGLGDFDYTGYGRQPDGESFLSYIESVCTPLPVIQEGALLVFRIRKYPQHCAIASNYQNLNSLGIIHAYQSVGKVDEHQYIDWWRDRLVGIYGLPGVNYD